MERGRDPAAGAEARPARVCSRRRLDPSSTSKGDLVGRRVGPYVVLGSLGAGAMASVYQARDLLLDRVVALKIHASGRSAQSLSRFRQEARAIAALTHPNLTRTLDVGSDGELHYHAMELVRGVTLRALLERGPLPRPAALAIALGVTRGLAAAHRAGVMHRDLKPSNVMLGRDGVVKLIDFGLAKQIEVEGSGDGATVLDWQSVRTSSGALLGTPAYMSPEQARGEPVDARGDVFSLGVLVFEVFAGRGLFRRGTPAKTLAAIIEDAAPRLDEVAPGTPSWLADVVARALEKEPLLRFADASALLGALEEAETGELTPSSVGELAALVASLLGPRVTIARAKAPPASLPPRPRAMLRGPFVGREDAFERLDALLSREELPIAVVGPEGVGKTRLVAEFVARIADARLAWVELDDASDEDGTLGALGRALGVPREKRRVEPIAEELASREGWVVVVDGLDGEDEPLERVLARARVEAAMRARRGAHVLVTRREPQAREGWATLPLEPLDPTASSALLAALAGEPSAGTDRARLIDATRGNPRALELFAGAIATRGEASVLGRGADAWGDLSPVDVALDVALEALSPSDRELLAALGVFRGAEPISVEAVLGPRGSASIEARLEALERAALLRSIRHPEQLGVPRFALEPTTARRLAGQLRARGDLDALRARHAAHYASAARGWLDELRLAPERERWRELLAERENLVAVGRRALATRDELALELGLVAASALARARGLRADDPSPEPLLDALVEATEALGAPHPIPLAEAALARADALEEADPELAEDTLARAIELARGAGDEALTLELHARRAELRARAGRLEPARRDAHRAVASERAQRDAFTLTRALEAFALVSSASAARDEAWEALARASRLASARADVHAEIRLALLGATLHAEAGEGEEERATLERALALARASADPRRAAEIALRLVGCSEGEGANERLFEAARLAREAGSRATEALALLAGALIAQGDELALDRALTLASEARASLAATGDAQAEAIARATLAATLGRRGALDEASTELTRATLAARSLDPFTQGVVGLFGALLDALAHPEPEHAARIRQRIEALPAPSAAASPPLLRATRRYVERALDALLEARSAAAR